jgi:hypothetical protein
LTHCIRARGWLFAAVVAGAVVSGCQGATVTTVTPAPSASAAAPAPPADFNHRYGNNAVAAADAFELQRKLAGRSEYWEVAISTEPAAAGQLAHPGATSLAAARAAARRATLTIATEVPATIRTLLAGGRAGQQAYCTGLLDQLRGVGYTGLTSAAVEVYFTERDHHAELVWSPSGAATYTVFDNDLGGDPNQLPGGSTPFATPPAR